MVVFGIHDWIGLVEQWAPGGGQVRGIPTVRLGSVGHVPPTCYIGKVQPLY